MVKKVRRPREKKTRGGDYPGFEHVTSVGGIDEYRLTSNGLTVLAFEDRSLPVVNVMVTYRVGSRNEAVGHTGATHLLEHLLFKGSKNFSGGERTIAKLLEAKGAKLNATTWFDRTNYFELVPREDLDTALAIEADRMRNAFLRETDRASEMTVVRNEFERQENDPFDVLGKHMWATAYQAHPYHHDTIGWRSDIENVSIARLTEFYDTFYWPNNATLSLIGDFNRHDAFAIVRKHFGAHPRSSHDIPVMYTTEPRQEGERRVIISRTGPTKIVGVAHKSPEGLHPDQPALSILATILAGGRASRLYRALVDTGHATDVIPWAIPFHDNGLFITYATLSPHADEIQVEGIIKNIYRDIRRNGVRAEELARARRMSEAETAFGKDGVYAMAQVLNEAIAVGDWTFFLNFPERVKAVTREDIVRVAETYLTDDQSTVGWFIPTPLHRGRRKKHTL